MGNSESAQGAWIGGWLFGALLAPVTGGASLIASAAVVTGSTVALVHHKEKRTPPSSNPMADRLIGFASGAIGAVAPAASEVVVGAGIGGVAVALPVIRPTAPAIPEQKPQPTTAKPTTKPTPTAPAKPTTKPTPIAPAKPTTTAPAPAKPTTTAPAPAKLPTTAHAPAKPTTTAPAPAKLPTTTAPAPAPAKPTTSSKPTTIAKLTDVHKSAAADAKSLAPAFVNTSLSDGKVVSSYTISRSVCKPVPGLDGVERCHVARASTQLASADMKNEAGVALRNGGREHVVLLGSSAKGTAHVAYETAKLASAESPNVRSTTRYGTDALYISVATDGNKSRVEVGGSADLIAPVAAVVGAKLVRPLTRAPAVAVK